MKNYLLLILILNFAVSDVYSQVSNSGIEVGDIFVIGEVPNNNYKYIDFPRSNFIIKKGGIANYNNIIGKKVKVTAITRGNRGKLVATMKLLSEKRFFNSHKYVKAFIEEAIANEELKII